MKESIKQEVLQRMLPLLDNAQSKALAQTLESVLCKYFEDKPDKDEISSQELLQKFLEAKRIEGCSEKTLTYYQNTINRMLTQIGNEVMHITTEDLRSYLTDYQKQNDLSRVTIDNVRRILSSFFSWLEDEEYLIKSPIRRIHKVKTTSSIKDTYSDEDLEKMRDSCEEKRDLALIDILASTGMRVGELVLLNQSDIDFNNRECKVLGKGNKERIVYFDARAKIHLQDYLDSRSDDCEALFVTLKAPHSRLTISGVESRVREIGKRLDIEKVHPHKFRRTLATRAIDKGMPIEQLQQLLGHKRIDTTLQYAMVKQSNVKLAHKKYIGSMNMGNWKTCTIADLGMVVGGATPSTKEAENYDGGTIAWITPKDLAGYSERFISHGKRDITETGLHSCSAQMMPRHSVLFSSRAPIGYVAIAENELCTNQGFKSVVPNEHTDYMFLYYLLLNNRQRIEHMGSGTTFKEVSGKTMRSIEVRVPESKEEQIRISSILSTIDDKIEENERINKNLYAA